MNNSVDTQPVNRRRFLHSSALLGGGLVLTSRVIAQSTANSDLNIGLIGAGAQGQILLDACAKIPGVKIRALCDIWESYNLTRASRMLEGLQQEHKTYTDYQDLLANEKELHGVLIATPDFCHAEQSIACLKAGIPVYCESMMSNTLDGAKSMIQAAKETGKLLQIGHQRRSNPYYRFGYDHILHETKMLGRLNALNAQWNRPLQSDRGWPKRSPVDDSVLKKYGYASMEQFRNWTWFPELGGGPLAELASHQIDVFNWYMGALPQSALASGGVDYYDPKTHSCPDTVMAILAYPTEKGPIHALYQTINANSNFGYYENFMGDEGTLYVSESTSRVKVYREPGAPDWDKWVKLGILESIAQEAPKKKSDDTVLDVQETVIPPSYNLPVKLADSLGKPHLENFFQAIRGQEALNCPAETAYPATVIILKIAEAVQGSKTVEFKPEDFQV